MRRRRQVDLLTGQNIELRPGIPKAFELWQVRMQIECADTLQKAETIECGFDFDRRRRPISFGSRMEPVAILDWHADSGEERARESAEPLLRRDCLVAVVQEVRELTPEALVVGNIGRVANVMVGAHEGEMVGLRKERLEGFGFGSRNFLAGAEGIEADDDESIGPV
jgi:hypothetical protein